MKILRSALSILFVLPLCAATPARALDEIAVSAGRFRVSDNDHIGEGGLEVRLAPPRFHWLPRQVVFVPAFGVMVNSDSSYYGYGSFRFEFPVGERWQITPQLGYGLYQRNGGFNLGGQVEFRSGLEVTREIGERCRLGLIYYHLSNAGIYSHNPGSESLVLTFAYRL
ncbi:MAG TPA: acyloxyacyl hydrolase [Thermoanaerobaculia bacterium]|nr:acyloxyacyl hydrolase [Thermoanaerobaculia bacterium]